MKILDVGEKLVCSEIREASGVCVWGSSVYKSNSIVLHYRIQSTISLHFPFIKGGAHMPLVDASETYLPGQPYLFLIICGQTIPARHNTANSSSSSSLPFCFCLHLVQYCYSSCECYNEWLFVHFKITHYCCIIGKSLSSE